VLSYIHVPRTASDRLLIACMLAVILGSIAVQLFQTSYYIAKFWFPVGVAVAAAYTIREAHTRRI
jgi:hypothetical protein